MRIISLYKKILYKLKRFKISSVPYVCDGCGKDSSDYYFKGRGRKWYVIGQCLLCPWCQEDTKDSLAKEWEK